MKVNQAGLPSTALLSFFILGACSQLGPSSQHDFSYKNIPIAQGTVSTGTGSTISFRGSPLPLTGSGISVGETLHAATVSRTDLSLRNIQEPRGKVRIISIVPSLDTKVCEQQTHYLSEKNKGLDTQVELITISIDTPFAQDRFAKSAGINNVTFLSDYRNGEFGRAHGLFLDGPHVLARAVMVVDDHNVLRYLQVTPDLGNMPDMEAAFTIARQLISS